MTYNTEKYALTWKDFQQNITSSYRNLWKDKDFSDVTLVCEDNNQIKAHKMILAACSPFFNSFLKNNNHSHPMIYMRGLKTKDLTAILEFIYHGEANVYQVDVEGFLSLAQELQLKGLSGKENDSLGDLNESISKFPEADPPKKINIINETIPYHQETTEMPLYTNSENEETSLDNSIMVPVEVKHNLTDSTLGDHRAKMDLMMEKIHDGEYKWKCTVCGKMTKGKAQDMRRHIETHIEGLSFPCSQCDKVCR